MPHLRTVRNHDVSPSTYKYQHCLHRRASCRRDIYCMLNGCGLPGLRGQLDGGRALVHLSRKHTGALFKKIQSCILLGMLSPYHATVPMHSMQSLIQ